MPVERPKAFSRKPTPVLMLAGCSQLGERSTQRLADTNNRYRRRIRPNWHFGCFRTANGTR